MNISQLRIIIIYYHYAYRSSKTSFPWLWCGGSRHMRTRFWYIQLWPRFHGKKNKNRTIKSKQQTFQHQNGCHGRSICPEGKCHSVRVLNTKTLHLFRWGRTSEKFESTVKFQTLNLTSANLCVCSCAMPLANPFTSFLLRLCMFRMRWIWQKACKIRFNSHLIWQWTYLNNWRSSDPQFPHCSFHYQIHGIRCIIFSDGRIKWRGSRYAHFMMMKNIPYELRHIDTLVNSYFEFLWVHKRWWTTQEFQMSHTVSKQKRLSGDEKRDNIKTKIKINGGMYFIESHAV